MRATRLGKPHRHPLSILTSCVTDEKPCYRTWSIHLDPKINSRIASYGRTQEAACRMRGCRMRRIRTFGVAIPELNASTA
jgi:hypothetical protein